MVRRDRVGRREVAVFRAVDELPDALTGPLWIVMQGGAVGGAPAAAVAAGAAGRPRVAAELLLAGTGAWTLAKVVKRFAQRPRPIVLLPQTRCRGREAGGLGFVSGHAAVAVALTAAALPHLGPRSRIAVLSAAPVVGLARMHAGAHLPLDAVGGTALGTKVRTGSPTSVPVLIAAERLTLDEGPTGRHTMDATLTNDRSTWPELLEEITLGRRGEPVTLEVLDEELGDQTPAHGLPLDSIGYDARDDVIVLALAGRTPGDDVVLRHILAAPRSLDLLERPDDSLVLRVVHGTDVQTLIVFTP